MYLKITDKCNMHCAHCCVSATMRGKHMELGVVRAALGIVVDHGTHVCLGGGEPTLHPEFWEIVGLCLGEDIENFAIISNGSKYFDRLAALARNSETFSYEVSLDSYHDPLPDALDARIRKWGAGMAHGRIRTVNNISAVGRAKTTGVGWSNACVCSDPYVRVNGDIYYCGCRQAPKLGNVLDRSFRLSDYDVSESGWDCCRQLKRKEKIELNKLCRAT